MLYCITTVISEEERGLAIVPETEVVDGDTQKESQSTGTNTETNTETVDVHTSNDDTNVCSEAQCAFNDLST